MVYPADWYLHQKSKEMIEKIRCLIEIINYSIQLILVILHIRGALLGFFLVNIINTLGSKFTNIKHSTNSLVDLIRVPTANASSDVLLRHPFAPESLLHRQYVCRSP